MNLEQGFNPKNLEALRAELNRVLSDAGFENLEFDTGRIKYENASCTIPLEVKIKGMKTMTDAMLEAEAKRLGLTLEVRNGRKLVGYKPRNRSYPFIFEDTHTGKKYKCDERQAQFHFSEKA